MAKSKTAKYKALWTGAGIGAGLGTLGSLFVKDKYIKMERGYEKLKTTKTRNQYVRKRRSQLALGGALKGGLAGGFIGHFTMGGGTFTKVYDKALSRHYRPPTLRTSTKKGLSKLSTIFNKHKLTKLAAPQKKKSYLSQVAVAAPIFGAKALLGDVPRKTVEEIIERRGEAKVRGLKPPKVRSIFKKSFTGRGLGTGLAGGAAGIMTAPIFLKGVQMASSTNSSEQRKGLGLIVGSGAVYQGVKGFGEGSGLAKSRGLSKAQRVGKGISYSLGRTIFKAPAAIALGLALGSSRRAAKKKKLNPVQKHMLTGVTAAGFGAALNTSNKLIDTVRSAPKATRPSILRKALTTRIGLRSLAPAATAGLIGGFAGGLITSAVVDKALKAIKGTK